MGNTVGSANINFWNLQTKKDAYIVGLWCADGYHRTSSIGLSSTDIDLIEKFRTFFLKLFPKDRIKLRTYHPDGFRKTKAYHLYVNSRPLLRKFKQMKEQPHNFVTKQFVAPYMAGRFVWWWWISGKRLLSRLSHCVRQSYRSAKRLCFDMPVRFPEYESLWISSRENVLLIYFKVRNREISFFDLSAFHKITKLIFAPRRDLVATRM